MALFICYFEEFHNSGQNLDSSQHTGDQAVVKTIGFSGRISVEEGQGDSVNRHSHGVGLKYARGIIRNSYRQNGRTVMANIMPMYYNDSKPIEEKSAFPLIQW